MEQWTWLLFAYMVGTAFGWYMGLNAQTKKVANLLLDKLIDEGYIRHRRTSDGDIELLKLNEED